MAVDRNGVTISTGDEVMIVGTVRQIDGDNSLVVIGASGNDAHRVTNLDLAKPDWYQPLSANTTALAAVTIAADQVVYGTGVGAWSATALTSFGRSLVDDASASAARTTLGLGAVAELASIANANMAAMAASTIKGSVGGGTPADLTMAQLRSILFPVLRCRVWEYAQLGAHDRNDDWLLGQSYTIQQADLVGYSQARMWHRTYTNSASGNTPKFRLEYYTSYSTTIGDYAQMGTSEISTSLASYGLQDSGWIDLAAGAKINNCAFAVIQTGGDSSATPRAANIHVEFR